MGGRLALYLAVKFPERFRRVILESASPGLRTESERLARRDLDAGLATRLRQEPLEEFLDNWYRQPLFETLRADRDKLAATINRCLANDPKGLARSLTGMGTGSQPSLWDRLPTITAPILLITGLKDHKFCAIARAMSDLCSVARWEEVPAAGHNVHVEHPRSFAKLVSGFLTEPIGGS
jgi:2-succinyl-6-hydroxy-2,4-cyclohexadiene-1-carboxylate synthase